MKKSLWCILVAAAMVFSASGFAGDLVDNGYLTLNPVYEPVADASGQESTLATMPGCATTPCKRVVTANYYQTTVDIIGKKTVLACGYESIMIPVPTKIPVAV